MIKRWINKIKPWIKNESGKIKYVLVAAFICMFVFIHIVIPSAAEKSTFLYGFGYFISLVGIYMMRSVALLLKNWLSKQAKQIA